MHHPEIIIFFPNREKLRAVIAYDEELDLRIIFEASAVTGLLGTREEAS